MQTDGRPVDIWILLLEGADRHAGMQACRHAGVRRADMQTWAPRPSLLDLQTERTRSDAAQPTPRRQASRQTDRQADRQTGRQAGK
jgi:hypothetical protein